MDLHEFIMKNSNGKIGHKSWNFATVCIKRTRDKCYYDMTWNNNNENFFYDDDSIKHSRRSNDLKLIFVSCRMLFTIVFFLRGDPLMLQTQNTARTVSQMKAGEVFVHCQKRLLHHQPSSRPITTKTKNFLGAVRTKKDLLHTPKTKATVFGNH